MNGLGPYAFYILAVYAICGLTVLSLFVITLFELRYLQRKLKGLNE